MVTTWVRRGEAIYQLTQDFVDAEFVDVVGQLSHDADLRVFAAFGSAALAEND